MHEKMLIKKAYQNCKVIILKKITRSCNLSLRKYYSVKDNTSKHFTYLIKMMTCSRHHRYCLKDMYI